MPDERSQTTDLEEAERLIVERLQRYAKRAGNSGHSPLLKPDKVIRIITERFALVRSGKIPPHETKAERKRLRSNPRFDPRYNDGTATL